jgi:formylglycine-generating enzyme required for sulfatase activity
MPKNIYRAGESGYITIPSETKTGNWLNTLILPFGTQDVKLIPVEYSSGNFFLAETELTRAAYQAVMGTTTYTSYLQYPILLTPAAVTTFFSTVQEQTGFSFRVPTDVEWQFAASGGNVSQNYIYSGSNTIDEVGWYSGNASSTLHYVKQLAPNELGFYDMTGNAEEHTYYSSSTWHSFGGSYTSTLAACKLSYGYISTYSYASTSSSYQYGLRIAMSH